MLRRVLTFAVQGQLKPSGTVVDNSLKSGLGTLRGGKHYQVHAWRGSPHDIELLANGYTT